ncbi:MAG: sigma-70 family RNA polymerase sigma factor [Saccharofermentans sp.]|nr:sigma-70 family RNA polymerase sigma factor [Saccharofermentans sp.]
MEQDQKIYALVAAAKQGDNNAFTELYNSSFKMVYHTCYGYLKSREDAEDTTQEIFIYIYNKLSELEDNYAFYGWVKTIAVHTSISKIRSRKDNVSYDDAIGNEEILEGDDNVEMLPDTYVLRDEKRKIVMEIMEKELSEVQYQTLFMYYYNDFKIEQIAQIMEVSEGTVKTRLKSAKIKVKQGIEDYENKTGDRLAVNGAIPSIAMVLKNVTNSIPVPFLTFAGVGGFGVAGSLIASGIAKAANLIVNLGSSASAIIPQGAGAIGMGAGANGQIPGGNSQMPTVPKAASHNPAIQAQAPGKVPGAQPQTPNQMPSAQAQAPVAQAPNAQTPVTQPQTPSAPIEPNAKPNAQSVQNMQNAAKNTAATVAKKTSKGVVTKIVAGVVAVGVIGGGAVGINKLINNKADSINEKDSEETSFEEDTSDYLFQSSELSVGSVVQMGNYNGEPLEWTVLETDGDRSLLFCNNPLFEIDVNEYMSFTNARSFLYEDRLWDIYDEAFSETEKEYIEITDYPVSLHIGDAEGNAYNDLAYHCPLFIYSSSVIEDYKDVVDISFSDFLYVTTGSIHIDENGVGSSEPRWVSGRDGSINMTGGIPEETYVMPMMWIDNSGVPDRENVIRETMPVETTQVVEPVETVETEVENQEFTYELSDYLQIVECEVTLAMGGGTKVTAPAPQFILANKDDQDIINAKLTNYVSWITITPVNDSVIIVEICCYYEYGEGGVLNHYYVIDLKEGRFLSDQEIIDLTSYAGQTPESISSYAVGEYNYAVTNDANQKFYIGGDGRLLMVLGGTGDIPRPVPVDTNDWSYYLIYNGETWNGYYDFITAENDMYSYVGIRDFEHDPL